jgi:hypothetical protein
MLFTNGRRAWRPAMVLAALAGLLAFRPAIAQTPASAAPPAVSLTDAEHAAVVGAWLHTAGNDSFDYKLVVYAGEQQARIARLSKWDPARGYKPYVLHADTLVDVDPALRVALAELHLPDTRSPIVRWVRKSGAVNWAVLELVKRGDPIRPRDADDFSKRVPRWLAQGLLPPPAELLSNPEHLARAAFWRANTPEAVQAVAGELSPNVQYGNGMTPLTQALLGGRLPVAQALLARGADPNRCGFWGCPLHLLSLMQEKDSTKAEEALKLLMAAGAKPDQRDGAYRAARNVALNDAVRTGKPEWVKRLLDIGASPDGAPGVSITPVAEAMLSGQRDLVRLLVERGATVLPVPDRGRDEIGRPMTLVRAALEGRDPGLAPYGEELMMAEARRSPSYRWDAHLEQDGKRIPLVDGATVALRAAPFKLVLTLAPPADEVGVSVAGSFSPKLAEEVRKLDRRNGLFDSSHSGALSEPPAEGSYDLLLYQTQPEGADKPDSAWGGHMHLSVNPQRKDFHEIRTGRREHVREFRRVVEVTEEQAPYAETPLEKLKGRRITLALGAFLPTADWKGNLVSPRLVTIELR